MSKVIDFNKAKLERDSNLSGPAICKECGHEWQAIAPVGSVALKCPSCNTHKGLFKGGIYPENLLWVCNCGCDVFVISDTTNILCWRCGTIHGQQFIQQDC